MLLRAVDAFLRRRLFFAAYAAVTPQTLLRTLEPRDADAFAGDFEEPTVKYDFWNTGTKENHRSNGQNNFSSRLYIKKIIAEIRMLPVRAITSIEKVKNFDLLLISLFS